YSDEALERYIATAVEVSAVSSDRRHHEPGGSHGGAGWGPVLIDSFLEDALEVDVDAVCDGTDVHIGGVLEHIEHARRHSGHPACVLPPHSLAAGTLETIVDATR